MYDKFYLGSSGVLKNEFRKIIMNKINRIYFNSKEI